MCGWSVGGVCVCLPALAGWLAGEAVVVVVVEDAGEAGLDWRIWRNNTNLHAV